MSAHSVFLHLRKLARGWEYGYSDCGTITKLGKAKTEGAARSLAHKCAAAYRERLRQMETPPRAYDPLKRGRESAWKKIRRVK